MGMQIAILIISILNLVGLALFFIKQLIVDDFFAKQLFRNGDVIEYTWLMLSARLTDYILKRDTKVENSVLEIVGFVPQPTVWEFSYVYVDINTKEIIGDVRNITIPRDILYTLL